MYLVKSCGSVVDDKVCIHPVGGESDTKYSKLNRPLKCRDRGGLAMLYRSRHRQVPGGYVLIGGGTFGSGLNVVYDPAVYSSVWLVMYGEESEARIGWHWQCLEREA